MTPITNFRGEYAFLSNFYRSQFSLGIFLMSSAEHAFQSFKTEDAEWATRIRQAGSPAQAKRLGRQCPLDPAWNNIKVGVMRRILEAKFREPTLRGKLLATEDRELIEGNTWGDTYWGVSGGVGRNLLGQLLMQERETIREETS